MPLETAPHRQVVIARAPASIDEAVDLLSSAGNSTHYLFLIEKCRWESQLAIISQARASVLHNSVVIHRTDLNSPGLEALFEICTALRPQLSAAQLVAVCQRLEDEIRSYALVKSVAKLSAANPTILQHLLSWLPSTSFVARSGGEVINAKKLDIVGDFKQYQGWVQMVTTDSGESAQSTLQQVQQLTRPSSVMSRGTNSAEFWGTPVLSEWCFAPADINPIVTDITNSSRMCEWCQEPFASQQCPLCSSPSLFGGPPS